MSKRAIEYHLDFEIGIDPYRRNIGGQTVPCMSLLVDDDDNIRVVVSQKNPGETGTWTDTLLEVHVALPGRDEYGYDNTPDAREFERYIRSVAATTLINRIAEGYSQDWSGRCPGEGNLAAVLDADATEALAELESAIADLPATNLVWWNVNDWFGNESWSTLEAAEIDALIAEPVEQESDVRLTESPDDFIMEQFAMSLQEELELRHADATQLVVRGAKVVVALDEDEDISAVLSVVTPAGNQWQAN